MLKLSPGKVYSVNISQLRNQKCKTKWRKLNQATVTNITISNLATLQPKVPAPSNRHLVWAIFSKSSSGNKRHRINFKLRSTADSASLKMRERKIGTKQRQKVNKN